MQVLFVVGAVLLTVATVVWMLFTRHHPENAASHRDDGRFQATADAPTDRPADASAESFDARADPRPGPIA